MFFQWTSLNSIKFSGTKCFFIVNTLMVLGIQTLKKQEWTEVSWQNIIDNAKFSVNKRLDNDFPIELTYFQCL